MSQVVQFVKNNIGIFAPKKMANQSAAAGRKNPFSYMWNKFPLNQSMAAWCNKSLLYHGGGREITNPSINKVRCNKSLPYHRGGRCRQGWAALWSTSWAGRTRSGCPAIKTKLFTIGLKWNILNSRIACLHGLKIYLTSKQDKIWKL